MSLLRGHYYPEGVVGGGDTARIRVGLGGGTAGIRVGLRGRHSRNIGLCHKGFEGSQDPLLRGGGGHVTRRTPTWIRACYYGLLVLLISPVHEKVYSIDTKDHSNVPMVFDRYIGLKIVH